MQTLHKTCVLMKVRNCNLLNVKELHDQNLSMCIQSQKCRCIQIQNSLQNHRHKPALKLEQILT